MGVGMAETGGRDGCSVWMAETGEEMGVGMAETGGRDGCRDG